VPDAAELLQIAVEIGEEAAALLRDRPADLLASSKTTPTDAVTVMDKNAERLILDRLQALRPADAVVSEESDGRLGSSDVTWIVDPLDGTVNYLYGLPHYAVSIAAELRGEVVAGVVVDVERRHVFSATLGGGAQLGGETIRCRTQSDLAQALVATGFGYAVETRRRQGAIVGGLLPRVRDVRRLGAAALDLCAVAAGEVDGYYEAGMHPWDWAAGTLIAREAGARVEGMHGGPPARQMVVAANPALFPLLHDLLVELGAGSELSAS
jgi:myo-inositol-1(or 4)-monophosphatase